jgi:hypothetical protein
MFVALFLADKVYMLTHYGFKFTDDDQTVIWLAAKDMLHGHFYQPCFYGQSYNPLVESLLSIPLLVFQIPIYMALPIVSAFLGMIPFLLFAFLLKRKFPVAAIFSLALPMALPWFYSGLLIVPRGFVTGMAIASVPCAILLFGKQKNIPYFIAGLLSMLALATNPNCTMFLAPVLLFAWLTHFKNKNFYIFFLAGFILATAFPLYIDHFYKTHDKYNVHVMHSVLPDFTFMIEGITHSDWYLQEISFIRPHAILYTIILQLAAGIFLFVKKRKTAAVSVLFSMIVMLASFSIPKVHDGGDRINFPLCRMFLGLPFSFVIFAYWIEEAINKDKFYPLLQKILPTLFLILVIFFVIRRDQTFKKKYPDEVFNSLTVVIKLVDNVCETCDTLKNMAARYHTGLIVFDGLTKMYNYGCPALSYPFETLYPGQERRRWRMNAEEKMRRERFILMPETMKFLENARKKNIKVLKLSDNPKIYLIETNGKPTFDVLRALEIDIDKILS